jgi:hypothetical protein
MQWRPLPALLIHLMATFWTRSCTHKSEWCNSHADVRFPPNGGVKADMPVGPMPLADIGTTAVIEHLW